MSQIVNWEYYNSLFSTISSETTFDTYEKLAEKNVDRITRHRASKCYNSYDSSTATDFQENRHIAIQDAICEVANKLYIIDKKGQGNGITSVSNNGYSESYSVVTKADTENEIIATVKSCLSGTGLVGAL